jgi:phosphate-selective porin
MTSYGEINLNRPTRRSQDAQADLRRFVLGYQHRFDEKTKVVAELELEHAVASASDPGEVALEQAYVERQLGPTGSLRAGLFLMPVGLLNENHEPPAFYGVERNFVETAIIPSTWREGGVQWVGLFDNGLTAQGGISTSFDLSKWDATSGDGRESPLGAVHQEMAQARSKDLALFGAANWRGLPGLLLGGSLFSGLATQGLTIAKARVTLWDVHARWTPGRWDMSALYARGTVSNTTALNRTLVGNPTLIPQSFDGAYAQAAYRLWSKDDYVLSPFVRAERYNTARAYADLGPGLTPAASPGERVLTLGANLQVAPGVVVKTDHQRFGEDSTRNRFNLGLGWSF